ncbi:PilC/PilY family type IV pilus protein [Thioalkalicoccus limnaeus]|uniref:PilC/PilY family type IV pilus protein n=1 Tax=Thioalkalicoccus limnaeus TaxID=120681 RepID=A0ABV4BIR6_9GAMM
MKRDLATKRFEKSAALLLGLLISVTAGAPAAMATDQVEPINIANYPLFIGVGEAVPPLTMLIMGRDHTLYYEAYNDASDLTGNGVLDVGYKPDEINYFGYFDSNLCYSYNDNRFSPVATANDKKCSGNWSGDFLNYITTSRIDALRKVLYGGRRIVDTNELTVLERAYIPQDAHSWGKEYKSIEHDGYDIRHYTPLGLPASGTRHLFANTTLLKSGNKEPLMRVLTDSRFRIWNWVAKERPVAGTTCQDGSSHTASCTYAAQTIQHNHPNNAEEFQALISTWGTDGQRCGSGPIPNGQINTTGSNNNPFPVSPCRTGTHEYYLTIINGQIFAPVTGDYQFATNGDDAVEFRVNGEVVSYWYGGHGRKGGTPEEIASAIGNETNAQIGRVTLTQGWHSFEFRHEERTGGDSYQLLWKRPSFNWGVVPASDLRGPQGISNTAPVITVFSTERNVPGSSMTDYVVRVRVCDPSFPESHCKRYPNENRKPTGILQQYGEADRMLFGLLSGSFTHAYNMRGGTLRKNIESFKNEVDLQTGIFREDVLGIVRTIDRFRIVDFNMDQNYQYQGGWLTNRPMSESNTAFPDWGNPIGEMMYESLRYFSGKAAPTSEFRPGLVGGHERVTLRDYVGASTMDLPAPAWKDPFQREDLPVLHCSPAAQLVISDVNPSYDTQYVPGSAFHSFAGDITGLNAANEANAIWTAEHGAGSRPHFIGQVGSDYDGAPTAKTVSGLGNIRGLSPAEPTKQGGYYSAGIARFGYENDIRADLQGKQNIHTFAVALASPLPRIEIPVGDNLVTLVPFAKSVGGSSISSTKGEFQPTNTIVDFFVESFANTDPACPSATDSDCDSGINDGRPFIRYRVNFEDVEQGADHDMDAIVIYDIRVNDDDTLTVELTSEYAAGGIIHHLGYVISGTTADGVYLEVRDTDTKAADDPAYFLDTPPGLAPGACDVTSPPPACAEALPLFATRTFTASTGSGVATVLENPLWYAAKYGSKGNEGLREGQPSPNYFLVTNAGKLQQQLEQAFRQIALLGEQYGTAAAASSAVLQSDTLLYTAGFRSDDWSGTLIAREINDDGSLSATNCANCWNAEQWLRAPGRSVTRNILTYKKEIDGDLVTRTAVEFKFNQLSPAQQMALNHSPDGSEDNLGSQRVDWLRGDEEAHNDFRSRTLEPPDGDGQPRLLGDIVNADPQFIGRLYNGPSRLLGAPSYRERPNVLFVGANDGMLHAFNAETGAELFAFVPSALLDPEPGENFSPLSRLMDPGYTETLVSHRYYVDGTPVVEEVYLDNTWKTVLVGTQGAGGRSVFALDVTTPTSFSANNLLWEFTDPDLGYNVGQPAIARVRTGENSHKWAAIFGNGYNGASRKAFLFVVDISDGSLIAKVDTGAGDGNNPNGLASPKWTHWPQLDLFANRVYAGDLLGNLWRFDNGSGTWSATKLFTAIDPDGGVQPITVRPAIGSAAGDNDTLIVGFGTGSFFRVPDAADWQIQSLYGLRDKRTKAGEAPSVLPISRSELLKQGIDSEQEVTIDGKDYLLRVVSKREFEPLGEGGPEPRGWYLDLCLAGTGGRCAKSPGDGERVISEATFPTGMTRQRIRFTTMIPNEDPCSGGRDGFLYDLDLLTGGRYEGAVFDLNRDGQFDEDDMLGLNGEDVPPSGIGFGGGERLTVIPAPGRGIEYGFGGDGEGATPGAGGIGLLPEDELYRRQSWQQLR